MRSSATITIHLLFASSSLAQQNKKRRFDSSFAPTRQGSRVSSCAGGIMAKSGKHLKVLVPMHLRFGANEIRKATGTFWNLSRRMIPKSKRSARISNCCRNLSEETLCSVKTSSRTRLQNGASREIRQ
jgi:hypothetical protein